MADLERHLADCRQGKHATGNFCAYCGKQLVLRPFRPFRVESHDGKMQLVVEAFNEHHAKVLSRLPYTFENLKAIAL
jgi:hypothetical protein